MEIIMETERLLLREMTNADFPALCRMLQDEEVMYAYATLFRTKKRTIGFPVSKHATNNTASGFGRRS